MKRLPVRGLTEGALLASLVAVLALVALYFPLLAVVGLIGAPLPLTVLVLRHGTRIGLLAALVAAIIGMLIAGPPVGLLIASLFAPLGIATGVAIRRGAAAPIVVLVGAATLILVMFADVAISWVVLGVNPITTSLEMARKSMETGETFYRWIGLSPEQIAAATAKNKEALAAAPRLLGGGVVVAGCLFAWGYYAFARQILARAGIALQALPPMTTWKAPTILLWVFVTGFALQVIGTIVPYGLGPAGQTVGLNLLLIATFLFTMQGAIVGWMLMGNYAIPRWLRWVVLVLMINNPLLSTVAFTLGVADSAFGLRRRWSPQRASS